MADQSGNGRNQINFDINIGDILLLMEAIRIGGNTEMMSGRRDAEKRLREYQNKLDAMIPDAARLFDGGDWCEINMALENAQSYQVSIADQNPPSWVWSSYRATGRIVITVGDRSWSSKKNDLKEDSDDFLAVSKILEELSPMDCERIQKADSALPESS